MDNNQKNRILRYEADLAPVRSYIDDNFEESTETVFRCNITDPPTDKDNTPQLKRDYNSKGEELDIDYSAEDFLELSEDEIKSYVGERALSVYVSKEKCEKALKRQVISRYKNSNYDEAKQYLEERRGAYIVKLQLVGNAGLLEKRKNKHGHKNFLNYEGVDINDYIVETYRPIDISDIIEAPKEEEQNDGEEG